jgi:hypothetical protein
MAIDRWLDGVPEYDAQDKYVDINVRVDELAVGSITQPTAPKVGRSMWVEHLFKGEPTVGVGRNGDFEQHGICVDRGAYTEGKGCVDLWPINSRGFSFSACLSIPVRDVNVVAGLMLGRAVPQILDWRVDGTDGERADTFTGFVLVTVENGPDTSGGRAVFEGYREDGKVYNAEHYIASGHSIPFTGKVIAWMPLPPAFMG